MRPMSGQRKPSCATGAEGTSLSSRSSMPIRMRCRPKAVGACLAQMPSRAGSCPASTPPAAAIVDYARHGACRILGRFDMPGVEASAVMNAAFPWPVVDELN